MSESNLETITSMKMAMVMHNDLSPVLHGAEIISDLKNRWPQNDTPDQFELEGSTLSFSINSSTVIIANMPAAIPATDLDGPCQTSLMWPDAVNEVRLHQSHSIITVVDAPDPITASTLLTFAVASFMASHESAIGVYWCDSVSVHSKSPFIELATTLLPDHLPSVLWVDYRISPLEAGRAKGFTHGMEALGHKEIEVENAAEDPKQLYDRLVGLVDYLLENGAVINDGETFGESESERIRCVFGESKVGHLDTVMRLEYAPSGGDISLTLVAIVFSLIVLAVWLLNGRENLILCVAGIPLLCLFLLMLGARILAKIRNS